MKVFKRNYLTNSGIPRPAYTSTAKPPNRKRYPTLKPNDSTTLKSVIPFLSTFKSVLNPTTERYSTTTERQIPTTERHSTTTERHIPTTENIRKVSSTTHRYQRPKTTISPLDDFYYSTFKTIHINDNKPSVWVTSAKPVNNKYTPGPIYYKPVTTTTTTTTTTKTTTSYDYPEYDRFDISKSGEEEYYPEFRTLDYDISQDEVVKYNSSEKQNKETTTQGSYDSTTQKYIERNYPSRCRCICDED